MKSARHLLSRRTSIRSFSTSLKLLEKKQLVVLGSGWGGYNIINRIDTSKFVVTVVSPRNHFLFTPLLASTTTGTLDFRSIIEPIRTKGNHDLHLYLGKAESIDTKQQMYDYLVLGVGADSNDFKIPGVADYAYFLKELKDARQIRAKIVEIFEKASIPTRTTAERRDLLHIVIVGGGPTGVEFAGELSDFFWRDLSKYFPDVPLNEVKITLLEASHRILPAFDLNLVKRAIKSITRVGVYIRTDSIVKEVKEDAVVLLDGTVIKCGLVVWSTGIAPRPFIKSLDPEIFPRTKSGRLVVDEKMSLIKHDNIFAIGDCAEIQGMPLMATAQVARQEGAYLAKRLNAIVDGKDTEVAPFRFKFLGLMLYAGNQSSIFVRIEFCLDSPWFKGFGLLEWMIWRSVYLFSLGSLRNRVQVPFEWLRTLIWGRDVTSFGDEVKPVKRITRTDQDEL